MSKYSSYLGDITRANIVDLCRIPKTCKDLALVLNMTANGAGQQCAILAKAGWLKITRGNRVHIYTTIRDEDFPIGERPPGKPSRGYEPDPRGMELQNWLNIPLPEGKARLITHMLNEREVPTPLKKQAGRGISSSMAMMDSL